MNLSSISVGAQQFCKAELVFCKYLVVCHNHCVFGQLTIYECRIMVWEIEVGHWIFNGMLAIKIIEIP